MTTRLTVSVCATLLLIGCTSPIGTARLASALRLSVPPTRATYRDVSKKVFDAYPIQQWAHCSANPAAAKPETHTCTGIERDARESFELGRAFPEAIAYLQEHQPGGGADEYAIGQLSIMLRLATIYEAKSLAGSGWPIGTKGRYYQKDQHIVATLQGAIRAAGCHGASQGLLDMVDLAANCKPGAVGFTAPPNGPYDNAAGDIGEIKTRIHLDKLTANQQALLHATHAAHAATTRWLCGEPGAAPGDVFGGHYAFEASATSVTQSAFFKMRDFWGYWNPRWTPAEKCKIAKLQDRMHLNWMAAVEALDWEHARIAANDHLQAHLLANLGRTPRLLYRFSVPGLLHNAWPARTWGEVLGSLP